MVEQSPAKVAVVWRGVGGRDGIQDGTGLADRRTACAAEGSTHVREWKSLLQDRRFPRDADGKHLGQTVARSASVWCRGDDWFGSFPFFLPSTHVDLQQG